MKKRKEKLKQEREGGKGKKMNTKINTRNRIFKFKKYTQKTFLKKKKKLKKNKTKIINQLQWESKMIFKSLIAFYKQVTIHSTLPMQSCQKQQQQKTVKNPHFFVTLNLQQKSKKKTKIK